MDITAKQKMFADEYIKSGNATEAYQTVYKCKSTTARANGAALLANTNIKEYIQLKNKKLEKSTIADMIEIKEYWTRIMQADKLGVQGGLKASELLAKTNGAFIDRVENKNDNTTIAIQAKVDLTKLSNEELDNLEKLIDKTTND